MPKIKTRKYMKNIDTIFEVSWEVCNKVGGINTVISTKALSVVEQINDKLIMIGPDIWRENQQLSNFIEDNTLLKDWRLQVASEGLQIRVGRWDVSGSPIAILLDFSSFFSKKDEIFAHLWEEYKLDSISGEWDYIEPAMFGYAAGKLIDSYHDYYMESQGVCIAHFHEWMTGSGILYLKEHAPHIGTVFTTHATIMGRVLAGNKYLFYGHLQEYNPNVMSRKLGIVAKYSMEKLCAQEADAFTTVSKLTNEECKYLLQKEVDVITPNGFEDTFVPKGKVFDKARKKAKNKLQEVATATLGYQPADDAMYVINSGRYEYRNKGIDVFIDSLTEIANSHLDREVVAFIMVPAHQRGVNPHVLERLQGGNNDDKIYRCTHLLYEPEHDAVLNKLQQNGLHNQKENKVKVIFSPIYLNTKDAIYGMEYYDLLIGFDVSVFASYYEPWGYTPMESLAFHIPTVTTNLAGYGLWLQEKAGEQKAAYIINRTENNTEQVIHDIASALRFYLETKDMETLRKQAFKLSRLTLWSELIHYYEKAYNLATSNAQKRIDSLELRVVKKTGKRFREIGPDVNVWKKIFIAQQHLSEKLKKLEELSKNLWWTWNYEAVDLFESIDPVLWKKHEHNPISLLESLDTKQLSKLEQNTSFLKNLDAVYEKFRSYMVEKEKQSKDTIAYFSMEYGIHDTLKIFSGGLGILAGDYIKEASDANVNMVAVGLLYRHGYFRQRITLLGDQKAEFNSQSFSQMPLKPVYDENGEWKKIKISLPRRVLYAKIWCVPVGRVNLYLLDTDIEENTLEDRKITHQLYGGGLENRFLQELLLGVGGIRLLDVLGIDAKHYHCNEGHAAMIGVERLRKYIKNEKLDFKQALELVRASTLFTTHTPVPAGHDRFEEDILRIFIPYYAERLRLSWDDFVGLGRVNVNDKSEKFSMSVLAAKLSLNMNGVSKIHGAVSRKMFQDLYPGYYPEELHISHVTNGVHLPSWTAEKWHRLYTEKIDADFFTKQHDVAMWNKIYDVADKDIWNLRNEMRQTLIDYLKIRLKKEMTQRMEAPKDMLDTIYGLNDKVLTIGFARRFATYKRAHLLFSNLDKLNDIINDPERPVQFIFAGKAHPADGAGQDLIKRIVEITKMPQFRGKIVFVENYDIGLGKKLVQGVDVWLNNPTRPLEASGTSGEKAVMNGVLNLSVLDGWWAEGYTPGAGWALPEDRTYGDQKLQDDLDASSLYHIIQGEIKPAFYQRNVDDIPEQWTAMIKKNIAEICPHFTMNRMLRDYQKQFYNPQMTYFKSLVKNDAQKAKAYSKWKDKVIKQWDELELLDMVLPNSNKPLSMKGNFKAKLVFRIGELKPEDIAVEIIFSRKQNDDTYEFLSLEELKISKTHENVVEYYCDIPFSRSGAYDYAFRVYPKHPMMLHRMDFPLAKWI